MRNKDLATRLEQFETLLKRSNEKPFNFVEAANYLSISHSTLYKLSYQRKIPSHKPAGKLLYFFKHELDEWISKGSDDCRVMSDEFKSRKRRKKSTKRESKNNAEDEDEPGG